MERRQSPQGERRWRQQVERTTVWTTVGGVLRLTVELWKMETRVRKGGGLRLLVELCKMVARVRRVELEAVG